MDRQRTASGLLSAVFLPFFVVLQSNVRPDTIDTLRSTYDYSLYHYY